MKYLFAAAAAAGVLLFLAGPTIPAQAVTLSGDVQATILNALSFTKQDALDFGSISAGTTASVVRIAPNSGARSQLAGGTATLVTGGSEADGTFLLDGDGGLTVVINVPASTNVISGLESMLVDNFIWSYNGGGVQSGTDTATLANPGPATLSIGADLHVDANQAVGVYSGTYSVTVNYQ